MNILIAGIIGVIMLFVGGVGYYRWDAARLEEAVRDYDRLPRRLRNGRCCPQIESKDQLSAVIKFFPSNLTFCVIRLSPTFTREIALELLQPYCIRFLAGNSALLPPMESNL